MMGHDLHPHCDCQHLHRIQSYAQAWARNYKCLACGQTYTITRGIP